MTDRTCVNCGTVKSKSGFRIPGKHGPTACCCLVCVAADPLLLATLKHQRKVADAKVARNSDLGKVREARRLYHLLNPEVGRRAVAKSTAKFKLENPEEYTATMGEKVVRREAAKIQRTPAWSLPEACRAVYRLRASIQKATGIRQAVDHSVPLRGKLVSGLHVPENLVVIPFEENASKGNRFDPMTYAWWPSCCPKPLQKASLTKS